MHYITLGNCTCALTRNTAAELVWEFRDEVIVDSVLQWAQNDDGTCVFHCTINNTIYFYFYLCIFVVVCFGYITSRTTKLNDYK
jgi:hypothetical protein